MTAGRSPPSSSPRPSWRTIRSTPPPSPSWSRPTGRCWARAATRTSGRAAGSASRSPGGAAHDGPPSATPMPDDLGGSTIDGRHGLGPTAGRAAGAVWRQLEGLFGGPARSRVILALAAVLALQSADTATVGASATQLREALHISNTDIGLLVAVTSIVAAVASVPFGM